MEPEASGKKPFGLIILVVVVLVILSGVLLLNLGKKKEAPKSIPVPTQAVEVSPTIEPLNMDKADSVLGENDSDIQDSLSVSDLDVNAASQSDSTLDSQTL